MSEQDAGAPREPVDVDAVLAIMLDQLAGLAWQKLGLQPDLATGKIERDLGQAKRVIDAVGAIVPILEPQLDEADRRQIQNLVRDLRINFVEQSKEATT